MTKNEALQYFEENTLQKIKKMEETGKQEILTIYDLQAFINSGLLEGDMIEYKEYTIMINGGQIRTIQHNGVIVYPKN